MHFSEYKNLVHSFSPDLYNRLKNPCYSPANWLECVRNELFIRAIPYDEPIAKFTRHHLTLLTIEGYHGFIQD